MKKIMLWTLIIFLAGITITGCAVSQGSLAPAASIGKTQSDFGQVAYIQKGNLWVKNMPNGIAKQLTTDGTASFPRWSVSGKWLLFQKKNQLWVTGSDGVNGRMVAEYINSFTWSSRDDVFYYTTEKDGILSAKPGIRESVVLFEPSQSQKFGRILNSPDGRYIAFEVYSDQPSNDRIPTGIYKIDINSSKVTCVFKGKPIDKNSLGTVGHLAGWSSDGNTIYLWIGPNSASLTADGVPFNAVDAKNGKMLLGNNPPGSLVHNNWFATSSNPNIAALITSEGGRETWTGKRLALIDLRNKNFKVISGQDQAVVSIAFSPSGDRLAYSAGLEEENMYNGDATGYADKSRKVIIQRHIWVTGTDGNGSKQLTTDKNYRDEYPIWIADGDYILFGRIDNRDRASLWMMSADGSNQIQIVSELSPFNVFGFYGYVEWDQWFNSYTYEN